MYALRYVLALCGLLSVFLALPCDAQNQAVVSVSSSATAAVLYEPMSGRVLFEQHAHTKRPMASTTKLMTALIAVETLPSDAVLTATREALAVEGSSCGLQVGDTVKRDDLLCGLLLASGNDAANVIALTVAKSTEAFAELMNAKAKEIGMTDTHFVTPSGLDAEGHGSSAFDMALLAAEVLKDPTLARICALRSATVMIGGRTVTLQNHNKLLSMVEGAVGMKTGYTSKAGRCLVSAAKRNGVTLIAVTLDCSNDWEEHTVLLNEGFSLLTRVTLLPETLPKVTVFGGETDTLHVRCDAAEVTVLDGEKANIDTVVSVRPFVWAPIAVGEEVGKIEYRLRGECLASVPIVVSQGVCEQEKQSWFPKMCQLLCMLFYEAVT